MRAERPSSSMRVATVLRKLVNRSEGRMSQEDGR